MPANHAIEESIDQNNYHIKWAVVYIDSNTGDIKDFDHVDCFRHFENWYTSDDVNNVRSILMISDIIDFSAYGDGTDSFVDELIHLAAARVMVEQGWPLELYCTGMSHDEAVFYGSYALCTLLETYTKARCLHPQCNRFTL